jgi:DnaD/phage-associated family protein
LAFRLNPTVWENVFAVPSSIVERHIKLCSGVSLKLLLVILCCPNSAQTESELSKRLNLPISDVLDALNYWIESGVLLSESNTDTSISVKASKTNGQTSIGKEIEPNIAPENKTAPPKTARQAYSRSELVSVIQSDKILSALVEESQGVMGKVFTSADLDCLVGLYSYYGLSAHYILTLLHFCVVIGKKSMGYAESVAAGWMSEGIDDDTVDRHVDRMLRKRSAEGKVRTAFGLDRALVAREREMIERWFFTFRFDMDMILLAYEITIERIGKLAFRYIDKILENWHQQGIKTIEQAKSEQKPADSVDPLGNKILEKFMRQ